MFAIRLASFCQPARGEEATCWRTALIGALSVWRPVPAQQLLDRAGVLRAVPPAALALGSAPALPLWRVAHGSRNQTGGWLVGRTVFNSPTAQRFPGQGYGGITGSHRDGQISYTAGSPG